MPAPIPLRFPDPPLADGIVTLRPPGEADIPAIVAMCREADVVRYTRVPAGYTEADARAFLAAGRRGRRDGAALGLAVDAAGHDGLCGLIAPRANPDDRDVVEIGYVVASWARGRGVATAALRLVTDWAMAAWSLGRVQLTIHIDNDASHRVAERAGFTREAVLRSWKPIKDDRPDLVMWSRLPGDP